MMAFKFKLLSKYENFSSYLLNLTLVIVLVIVIQNFKSFSLEKSIVAFGYAFGGLLLMCLMIALPLDLIISCKDREMCSSIAIDYENEFLRLEKAHKKALRKKYKSWQDSGSKEKVEDWLSFD